ncbi:retention module-containing protein [Comamonas sp. GB3 AK4-5]|uniref:retention module-containing protein n=1 Tax=Comamonas sp. GB3 AK4-5 TaxID=3231487 RepID=UPI00351DD21F
MATTTVLVTQLTGQAWVRDADGNLTALREGMRIAADAQVVTASGSTVQLQADGQPPLTLGESQNVALAPELFDDIPASEAAAPAAVDPMVDQLIAAINAGQDPLDVLEPAAATLSGGGGGGSTFVRLSQVLESTAPLNLAYPRGATGVAEDRNSGDASAAMAAAPGVPTDPTTPTTPVDPTDPTTPTTPVDPTDPTTPTTPVDPTDPTTPTTPVDPTDPTTPTTPVDPTDPTTPTTPVDPTDPTTPTTPVDPTDPTTPTTPVDPTDPTTPTTPVDPTDPTTPTTPVDPTDPTTPTTPVDPTDPTTPTTPVDPTDPSTPTTPVDPTDPTTPTTPVDPIDPTTPTTPVDPTDPTTPTTPVDPTDPTTPTTPVDPTDPTTPTTPVDPTDPTTPTTPVDPTDPTTPTTPVDPTDPTTPTTPVDPTDPTTPTTPVDPTDPTTPTTPVDPTDPTTPTTPVDPTDPTTPTTPVDPTDPTTPTTPVDPTDPTTPTTPVDPTDPTTPTTPVDPTDPTTPTTPVDPTDPTTPTTPVDPTDPTTPTTPVDPTDPTTPTTPVDPTDPTTPTTPVDPTDPTTPTTPVDPTDPTTPTTPVDPTDPTTPTTPVDPTDPTTPTTPVDPTDPTTPTTPVDPTDPTTPTTPVDPSGPPPSVTISLKQTDVEQVRIPGETIYTKDGSSISVGNGGVAVVGMDKVEVTAVTSDMGTGTQPHAVIIDKVGYNHTTVLGTTNVTGTWDQVHQKPLDILVLPKALADYDLSGLVYVGGVWKGTIKDKASPDTLSLTLDRFAGILFGDGQTVDNGMPGFDHQTPVTGHDLVTLQLDAVLGMPGDPSDHMSDVTVSGLGNAAVVSVQYQGHALVEGSDYRVSGGVLTLYNGSGLSMADVQIKLQVPLGSPDLNLHAEVSATNHYGQDSAHDDLLIHVAAVDTGGGDGGGTDPTTHVPEVHLEVSSRTVDTAVSTPKDPLAGTMAVNGGATDPSGNGFNLDAAGNVVAIGFNVHVWGTQTTKGPDGHTAINDFANGIQVYKDGSFSAAQFGVNLIRYGYETNGQSNANASKDHAGSTDLFLLHSQSGFWAGNGNTPDGDKGNWRDFNNFTGNSGKLGSTAPDYVVLIGDAAQGAVLNKPTSNNGNSNANVLESVSIMTSLGAKVVNGGNRVEGVIAGGELLVAGHSNLTTLEKVVNVPDTVTHDTVYDVAITATLPVVAGSDGKLHAQLVLEGIPVGAKVSYHGVDVPVGADGKITIAGELSADGHTVSANLSISQVQDSHFTLTVHAESSDGQHASSTATGDDTVNVLAGTDAADTLLGSDGHDMLLGGAGHDTLLGGGGDDRFVWQHGDQGTVNTPAVDVVKDFGNGHDVLDLSDLLQGENASNLSSYLGASIETVNGRVSTVLNISSNGHLGADGVSGADQKIVLEGLQLDTSNQAKLLQELISQGKLHVDQ